jgi:nicotinamidase/pyrazinamidase
MKPGDRDVLLVVDVQNDFIPGGALAVKDGDQVITVINRIAPAFAHVVLTQDWHTPGHISFASSHPGKKPFETVTLPYGTQVLWPDHCVQNTPGAALHKDLNVPHASSSSARAIESRSIRTPRSSRRIARRIRGSRAT